MRVVRTRTGVVLSPSGGALAKMLPFFKLGIGGPVAGGRQYVPWIHLDDVVGGLMHCLDPRSGRAGEPHRADPGDQRRAVARARACAGTTRRPAGSEHGDQAALRRDGRDRHHRSAGIPARLGELGYEFRHPGIEPALKDVLSA